MITNYSFTKIIQQIYVAYKWDINVIEKIKKNPSTFKQTRNGLIMNLAFLDSQPWKYYNIKIGKGTNQNNAYNKNMFWQKMIMNGRIKETIKQILRIKNFTIYAKIIDILKKIILLILSLKLY